MPQLTERYLPVMGFYSYTCAKTHLPILASTSWGDEYSKVVVLDGEGTIFRGLYDGYGRVVTRAGAEVELDDGAILSGKVKLVSGKFYSGERFDELGRSSSDPGQGHFHDSDRIDGWYANGGFPSWADYRNAYFSK